MAEKSWDAIRLSTADDEPAWEIFHENSKSSRYGSFLPNEAILARMARLHQSLPFDQCPEVALPTTLTPLSMSLTDAVATRESARDLEPTPLSLRDVATLLHYAYGVTRDNAGTTFPRPFRVVPSGGALYPLDLFFHSSRVEGLPPGLYHYDPTKSVLHLVQSGDRTAELTRGLVQQEMGVHASLVLFITAIFERSTFKYGDRGYRFVLLEAGHVAQNVNLVAGALGLGVVNLGGYFDRQIDDLLGLDGVTQSAIYLAAIGGRAAVPRGGEVVP